MEAFFIVLMAAVVLLGGYLALFAAYRLARAERRAPGSRGVR